jgi:hypothetical protein
VDVSGAAGAPIVYIGDTTGTHTDSVGGHVRITGSADDIALTRDHCIEATSKHYRTFRGFVMDLCSGHILDITTHATNWTMQDCWVAHGKYHGFNFVLTAATSHLVERCIFLGNYDLYYSIQFSGSVQNCQNVVRNCVFLGIPYRCINFASAGGALITNCLFAGTPLTDIRAVTLPAGYTPVTVENCVFDPGVKIEAGVLGMLVEDYNSFSPGIAAPRTNVAVGANSDRIPYLPALPLEEEGFRIPWRYCEPSPWSMVRAIAHSANAASDDFYGRPRPTALAKHSRGAFQWQPVSRETTTKRTGTASLKLSDAGRHQMWIPITAVSTTVTVYVYREANYAGTAPQMIIKQPGQVDLFITDAGPAGTWNALTHTWVPAALPTYVVVELVSDNTAVAGAYAVYFDDLGVT